MFDDYIKRLLLLDMNCLLIVIVNVVVVFIIYQLVTKFQEIGVLNER